MSRRTAERRARRARRLAKREQRRFVVEPDTERVRRERLLAELAELMRGDCCCCCCCACAELDEEEFDEDEDELDERRSA